MPSDDPSPLKDATWTALQGKESVVSGGDAPAHCAAQGMSKADRYNMSRVGTVEK